MKNINEVKNIIKTICSKDDTVMLDHDLNVSILDKNMRVELNALVKGMTFNELNRVVGYFIDELEGDGINVNDDEMDDPDIYLSFCINECDQTEEELQDFVKIFKDTNKL